MGSTIWILKFPSGEWDGKEEEGVLRRGNRAPTPANDSLVILVAQESVDRASVRDTESM